MKAKNKQHCEDEVRTAWEQAILGAKANSKCKKTDTVERMMAEQFRIFVRYAECVS